MTFFTFYHWLFLPWRWPFFFFRCLDSPVAQLAHQMVSLTEFFSFHAPFISLHPSFFAPSSLVSSLSYPSDVLVTYSSLALPSPVCLPVFFPTFSPSAVEVRHDAEPQSLPVFNYINKTPCEMEWPRTPQTSQYPPISPSLPSCYSAGLCLSRFSKGPVQLAEDCVSRLIVRHNRVSPSLGLVLLLNSSGFWHACFAGGHVRVSLLPWPAAGGGKLKWRPFPSGWPCWW